MHVFSLRSEAGRALRSPARRRAPRIVGAQPNQRLVPTVRRASLRSARRPAAHPQVVGRAEDCAMPVTSVVSCFRVAAVLVLACHGGCARAQPSPAPSTTGATSVPTVSAAPAPSGPTTPEQPSDAREVVTRPLCDVLEERLEIAARFRDKPEMFHSGSGNRPHMCDGEPSICGRTDFDENGWISSAFPEEGALGSGRAAFFFGVPPRGDLLATCNTLGLRRVATRGATEQCDVIASGPLRGMVVAINSECAELRVVIADVLYRKTAPKYATFPSCDDMQLRAQQPGPAGELHCADTLTRVAKSLERYPWRP